VCVIFNLPLWPIVAYNLSMDICTVWWQHQMVSSNSMKNSNIIFLLTCPTDHSLTWCLLLSNTLCLDINKSINSWTSELCTPSGHILQHSCIHAWQTSQIHEALSEASTSSRAHHARFVAEWEHAEQDVQCEAEVDRISLRPFLFLCWLASSSLAI